MSQFQIRCVIHSEAVLFAESQDDFRLSGAEGRFNLDGQARELVPKECRLICFDPFPTGSDQEAV